MRGPGVGSPLLEHEIEEGVARYRALAGTGRTSNRLDEAALAAIDGRVDVLFVTVGIQIWGTVDNNQVVRHDSSERGDFDLLDLAGVRTLLQGGSVYALAPDKMPDPNPLAAILRY